MFPPSHQKTLALRAVACALILAGTTARADSIPAHVVAVHDGDTITVQTQAGYILHVRIAAIDAPELKQPFGQQSRDALCAIVCEKDVTVRAIKLDRYGRTVAIIIFDKHDVGLELLGTGNAWLKPEYLRAIADAEKPAYIGRAADAQTNHRGIFATDNAVAPWEFRKRNKTASK